MQATGPMVKPTGFAKVVSEAEAEVCELIGIVFPNGMAATSFDVRPWRIVGEPIRDEYLNLDFDKYKLTREEADHWWRTIVPGCVVQVRFKNLRKSEYDERMLADIHEIVTLEAMDEEPLVV